MVYRSKKILDLMGFSLEQDVFFNFFGIFSLGLILSGTNTSKSTNIGFSSFLKMTVISVVSLQVFVTSNF